MDGTLWVAMPYLVPHGRAHVFASDAGKFKEAFEKIQKNDFTGLEPIKQDAEDAEKVGAHAYTHTHVHTYTRTCLFSNTSHSPPFFCIT